jgi:hypothetical protein
MMKRYLTYTLVLCVTATATVQAAASGITRFWNLTGETITQLNLAPAGTTAWGPDQCHNDPDGGVDFDERLKITGIATGRYDVRFTDKTGRTCMISDVEVTAGKVFSLGTEALAHCTH